MRVFISWSGERSRLLAEIMRDWLPCVVQAARPYYTPDDIAKGTRWSTEISLELSNANFGLICLTSQNLAAPWLLFEAGALSKSLTDSRVCPILFGVDPTAVAGPLAQFQATRFERGDIRRLLGAINAELRENALRPEVLDASFEVWWPRLETKVQAVLRIPDVHTPVRPERELLSELLVLSRGTLRAVQDSVATKPYVAPSSFASDWPQLVRKSLQLLHEITTTVSDAETRGAQFAATFRERMRVLGLEHSRELQVSIVAADRLLIYHDWEWLLGTPAVHIALDGYDVFETVFSYPSGAVAWLDRGSNVSGVAGAVRERQNIALFACLASSQTKIVVEAHVELE